MTDIDREVAEKVMGWHVFSEKGATYWDPERSNEKGEVTVIGNWSPSARIEHAWEVVDHLKNHRRYLTVFSLQWSDGKGWWCNLYPHIGTYIETDYYETAPLAICKAALAAVEQK